MKQRFTKRTRLVSALLTLAMVFTFLPISAFAATDIYGPVYISDLTFPDETFQNYVKQFDENNNGTLSPEERYKVTEIDVRSKKITSLKGIEFFPNLTKLICYDNELTELDVSKNKELKHLDCDNNQLTSLQLDDCTNLGVYSCNNNEYSVQVYESTRILDPSTLPGNFDISRVRNMKGATKNADGTMTVNPGEGKVLYEYRLFRDYYDYYYVIFTLNVEFIPEGSIKQVNLRVNTPKNGKMPDETVVILDNGADVCDAKIYWVEGDGVGGKPITGTFRPGKRYTLQVGLYAKPGYKFSKDTVCTVNGRDATFLMTTNNDTEYVAIKHYSVSLNPGGFEHDHKMEMTHDEYSHWMECPICHTVQDTEGHVYDDDKDTTCNVCGYVRSLTPGGGTTTPEAGKYQLTVTDGVATLNDGSTGAVLNVKPGDTVTLTADTTKFPENEEFGWWEITPYGSVSNTLTGQYQRTATFTMPSENVSARAMSKSAGVSTGGDDGGGGGGAAILLVGGAAVAGLVGYGVYSYVSEQQLKALLPEGVAMPENRAQTALLLWNTAGRPEPSEAPAFKDVADPDTAKAAQWCVEHGLMDQKLGGRFAPDNSDPAYKTLNAYQQLVG